MSKLITIKVNIMDGAGGVFIDLGLGEDKIRHITSSMNYNVYLETGHYVATLAGSAPTNGSITLSAWDGNSVLKSVSFPQSTFTGFLIFDVK
jgi:hypothetical protein